MAEPWVVFYGPDGKKLYAMTVRGTFSSEIANTVKLLAHERGLKPEEIKVKFEER